jgi:hypothetical protein
MARHLDDLSDHEIVGVYSRYVRLHGRSTHNWRTGETEYHGSCPWCGGTDRFLICLPSSRYTCGIRGTGCKRWGRNLLHFLRSYEPQEYPTICRMLDLDPGAAPQLSARERMVASIARAVQAPDEEWRKTANLLLHMGEKFLMGNTGSFAREALHARGFRDDTILHARLGYIPRDKQGRWYSQDASAWGLEGDEVWYYDGLYIPSIVSKAIWKLNVRRADATPRYMQIRGSADAMFGIDLIQPGLPLVLCEGELDALSGWQECGDMANFLATGSSTRCRNSYWAPIIKAAPRLLLAFDDDSAGQEAARYWKGQYRQASILTPEGGKDINDMLVRKQDLRSWLGRGLEAKAEISSSNGSSQIKEEVMLRRNVYA